MNDRQQDPRWAGRPSHWDEPTVVDYPLYSDPAYAGQQAGQQPPYTTGYPTPASSSPTQYWQAAPPPGEPPRQDPPAPESPKSPRWLFLLAGATVLLVAGLAIALVISSNSEQQNTAVPPLTTALTPSPRVPIPTVTPPRRTQPPPTGTSPTPTPRETGPPQTVGYQVSGTGRALSIAYVDTGGGLQTEFNVTLPWSKQVSLSRSIADAAMVTVITAGGEVTCSLTVDGTQTRQRSGAFLTICAAAG